METKWGLRFPTGVELPGLTERIQSLIQAADGKVTFGEGYAESDLVTVWRCAWERSYLDASRSNSVKSKTKAADVLADYYEQPLVQKFVDDPDHVWYQEVIEPALKGDTGALEDDLVNSCGAPFAV